MAKVKRYADEGEVKTDNTIEDEGDRGEMTEGQAANNYATRQMEVEDESDRGVMQKAKPKVVTKEQMKAAGYDNLRDYLNATNPGGPLKRRDGSAAEKPATSTPAKTNTPKLESTSNIQFVRNNAGKIVGAQAKKVEKEEASTRVGSKTTEEGLAKMRAKDEAQRASFASPFENLSSVAKKLREKAGITSYKKGGMTASSRADGIAQRGKTRGKMC